MRGRALTVSVGSLPTPISANPSFTKELDALRDVLRSSKEVIVRDLQNSQEQELEKEITLQEAMKTIEDLKLQLKTSLEQQEKLSTELRIERNLRLELEKGKNSDNDDAMQS